MRGVSARFDAAALSHIKLTVSFNTHVGMSSMPLLHTVIDWEECSLVVVTSPVVIRRNSMGVRLNSFITNSCFSSSATHLYLSQ